MKTETTKRYAVRKTSRPYDYTAEWCVVEQTISSSGKRVLSTRRVRGSRVSDREEAVYQAAEMNAQADA